MITVLFGAALLIFCLTFGSMDEMHCLLLALKFSFYHFDCITSLLL